MHVCIPACRLCLCRLGLSRQNVFAGLSGFYFVRDKFPTLATGPELPGIPYPAYDGVVPLGQVRELPLAIQVCPPAPLFIRPLLMLCVCLVVEEDSFRWYCSTLSACIVQICRVCALVTA